MDPITVSVVTILSKYALDKGVELGKAVGPKALDTAKDMFRMVLAQVKDEAPRTAKKFPENPEGYKTPMEDVLQETIEADSDFAEELKTLLAEYEKAAESYEVGSGATHRATLEGSGAIAQGAGAVSAGEHGFAVGGDVGGSISTGSGPITDTQDDDAEE